MFKVQCSKILTVLWSYGLTVFLIILFLFSSNSVSAQRFPHEISVHFGGGFNAFVCQKPVSKVSSTGFGVDVGVGFASFFSQNWGIHTGVGFGFSNIKNEVSKFNFITPEQKDCDDNLFDLHTTLNDYSERHKTMFVSIPLMVQYQTKLQPISYRQKDKRAGFYALAGAKALLLVNNNYTAEVNSLYNMAYYPEFKNWISYQPEMGLGSFKGTSVKNKLKFNVLATFSLEAGFKWQLGKKLYLYSGVFFDIGLYDTTKKQRINYKNLTSQASLSDLALLDFAKRMNFVGAGLKLRLAFPVSKNTTCCW